MSKKMRMLFVLLSCWSFFSLYIIFFLVLRDTAKDSLADITSLELPIFMTPSFEMSSQTPLGREGWNFKIYYLPIPTFSEIGNCIPISGLNSDRIPAILKKINISNHLPEKANYCLLWLSKDEMKNTELFLLFEDGAAYFRSTM